MIKEGLNLSLSEVIFIYNQIKKVNFNNNKTYGFLKFKLFIFIYFKLRVIAIIRQLFVVNNYFLYFLVHLL